MAIQDLQYLYEDRAILHCGDSIVIISISFMMISFAWVSFMMIFICYLDYLDR
jgi:hypothetical protein